MVTLDLLQSMLSKDLDASIFRISNLKKNISYKKKSKH